MKHKPKCKRCGECCRLKFLIQGVAVWCDTYCPALDTKTMLCTVFNDRHALAAAAGTGCVPIWLAKQERLLPGDCAYVLGTGYQPPYAITEQTARRRGWGDALEILIKKEQARWGEK